MFEAAELGQTVSPEAFEKREKRLRSELLEAQYRSRDEGIPIILIVSGVEGAGRGDVVNRLHKWLDVRQISTHAFWEDTDDGGQRPYYWRFWRAMPRAGSMAVMFGSWYRRHVADRVTGRIDQGEFEKRLHQIEDFERLLTDDGILLLKFWFHLTRREQVRRLRTDRQAGRVLAPDQEAFVRHYNQILRHAERAIRITDSGSAPWHIVESTDSCYRDLTVGETLLSSLRARLDRKKGPKKNQKKDPKKDPKKDVSAPPAVKASVTILDRVDLEQVLDPAAYESRLEESQARLWNLGWRSHGERLSTVVVLEGWDAAGKGSALRRITQALDARLYQTISVGKPTDEERSHHYLWRFWRHIPPAGYMTFYDRSWYGRVLVERVEGLATVDEWRRAYQEINSFEEQLVEHGVVLLKFWIHISREEQLRRFKDREKTKWKRYKITEDDWRNREKWDDYLAAVNDMVARTSSGLAPWTLVGGNDKRHARIQILEALCSKLEQTLGPPAGPA